jgi:two-component system, OmpR family, sensor histidine kinase BaeS
MARRLSLAFAVAAVAAVGLLGGLTWLTAREEVSELVTVRNEATARDVAAALGEAYAAGGSWETADLHAARTLAVSAGAALVVRDTAGRPVAASARGPGRGAHGRGPMLGMHPQATGALGPPHIVAVAAGGVRVGTAELRFPVAPPAAEQAVRRALGRTVLVGGVLASALAVAVGLLVARRISRPLQRLTEAASRVRAGDRSARVGAASEPAELGALSAAFDAMAETLEREEELRRAFAADVAHELRTPLAIAQGELEALLDGIAPATPDRLRSLHEELLRLGRVVEDVETLAAAEAARFRLRRERVDLADVARDGVAALRSRAEAAGVDVAARVERAPVEADRARLDQVLRNLLSNALKFTPQGGRVLVSVSALDGDARLVVEDSGPGIDEEERPHVFDRFWRGRSARTTGGSGVGLAVVAELVHAHGGEVGAEAAAGGGARFTVRLPRA